MNNPSSVPDYRAYVHRQIESLTAALTRVMFGDFTAVAQTQKPDEAFGYLCVMINVAINAARNAHDDLRAANEELALANDQLRATIAEQRTAQEEVRRLNDNLERLVDQRTAELSEARQTSERASLAKSEFLSRMSHELRTPLNAVLGFAQLLELSEPTAEQNEAIGHILKGGTHLLELINEVLDIGRIETGDLALSPEAVLVGDLLAGSLDLIRPLAIQRSIHLADEHKASCDQYVFADRQRLTQVLINLMSNAVKYNRPGGTVAVSCERTGLARLRIKVSDTGPGIRPEQLEKLFTPFERLGAERTDVEGTGVGLALSRLLSEAMGGSLDVDTELGQGSTFWVELPLVEGPVERYERPNGATTPNNAAAAPTADRHAVLYIEDNLANLKLVQQVIAQREGLYIIPSMQGRLGLELARDHHPALILLDLHLPDMNGDEILQRLREDPSTAAIPVVMVSADATPGHIQRLLAAGASAYLTKPFDVRELLRILDDLPAV